MFLSCAEANRGAIFLSARSCVACCFWLLSGETWEQTEGAMLRLLRPEAFLSLTRLLLAQQTSHTSRGHDIHSPVPVSKNIFSTWVCLGAQKLHTYTLTHLTFGCRNLRLRPPHRKPTAAWLKRCRGKDIRGIFASGFRV